MEASRLAVLESRLDDFDPAKRAAALSELARALKRGEIAFRAPRGSGRANVHFHTFFSFNIAGWSPSRVAWEAARAGLEVAGSVDFDVLDAAPEILAAGDLLGLPVTASLETRVHRADCADREINSPGEPGVAYFMAAGFVRTPPPGSGAARVLADLRIRADARTREVARRVNAAVGPAAVEYDADVLPLTPAGNATERHLLAAYDAKARAVLGKREALADFWGRLLGLDPARADAWLDDAAKFRTALRAKLMKKGGPGYIAPDAGSFPPAEDVARLAGEAGAVPCAAWLDGESAGEADAAELIDGYVRLGCRALAIVPERNWNIADAAVKKRKLANLAAVAAAAKKRGLFFAVGTEMNNYGQPFVDDFLSDGLRPHADDFLAGAWTLYGHTVLERYAGMGLSSPWARERFGDDWARANAFYRDAGRKAVPGRETADKAARASQDMSPERILAAFSGENVS